MRCVLARGLTRKSPALLAVALLLLVLNGGSAGPVLAQGAAAPDVRAADDEFSRQLNELKKTFTDLSKRIDDSAQTMGRSQNAEAARKEIEELRAHVGALLGAVADNGTVWNLGAKALRRAEDKLKALDQETRYKPEEKQFLIQRWRELKVATEGAIGELEKARKDFAELLRTLQTNEDFIDELLQVREHEKALEVIQRLTDGIRDASDKLKKLLTTIKPPGV